MDFNPYNYALEYNKNGISCIPVEFKGKKPLVPTWLPYTKELPNEDLLKTWFNNKEVNLAVVTGEVSDLAIIDIDSELAYHSFKYALDKKSLRNAFPVVKSGRGYHLWFSLWEYNNTSISFKLETNLCHIKINKNLCTSPPSTHSSGRQYGFVSKLNFYERSRFDLEEIIRLLKYAGAEFESRTEINTKNTFWASELCQKLSDGSRNDSAAKLCGLLIRKFWYDPGLIKGLMIAWNNEYCSPPLADREINYLVDSEIKRYQPRKENYKNA